MWFAGIGALTNLVLNALMIPTMGALGASVATLITEVFSVLIAALFFPKTRAYFGLFWQSLAFQGVGRFELFKRQRISK